MTKILTAGTMTLAAILVSLAVPSSAIAADGGNVPADQLAQLGLAQMDVLSDTQGQDIRGSGFFFFGFGHGHHSLFLFLHHGHGSHGHHGHSHSYLTSGVGFHHFLHVISHSHGGKMSDFHRG